MIQAVLLIALIILMNIVLLWLLLRKYKSISNHLILSLLIFNIAITSWQISLIIIRFGEDSDFLHRIAFMGALGGLYAALNLSLFYPSNNLSKTSNIILWTYGLLNLLLIGIIGLTNIIIEGYKIDTGTVLFGRLGTIFLAYMGLNLIAIIINFTRRYRTEERNRFYFKYAFLGIIFYSFFALIFNLLLPALLNATDFTLVGALAALVPQSVIVYSLVSTRLYTVKFILGSVTYVITRAVIFYLVFYLVAHWENRYLEGIFTKESYIVGIFIAIAFSLFTIYTERFLKQYFEKNVLYSRRLSPIEARDEITKETSNELDISKIVSTSIRIILKNFNVDGVGVALYKFADNQELSKIDASFQLNATLDELKVDIANLAKLDRQVITNKEAEILGAEHNEWGFVNAFMDKSNIDLLIPIFQPDELFGYIALEPKKNREPYTREDISLLKNIRESLMLASSRALLYRQVKDFNTVLQREVEERTKELRTSNTELQEALRKERDMVDIFSHELRTPAGTARNSIQMIDMLANKDGVTAEEFMSKSKEYSKRAVDNMRRLSSIITRMLDASKLDTRNMQVNITEIDAIDVVNDSVASFADKAKQKGLELKFIKPNTPVTAHADRDATQEAIDNLVDNAIKYTAQGTVTLALEVLDDFVKFTVNDTGRGIPPEEIPNLGKKFYRVDNYLSTEGKTNILRPDGTGIGLYVVKGLVQMMGGRLEIQSQGRDKGSTFTVFLPR